jgi:hypothetical protein
MRLCTKETINFEILLSIDEAYKLREEIKTVLIDNKTNKLNELFTMLTEKIKSKHEIETFKI